MLPFSGSGQELDDMPSRPSEIGVGAGVAAEPAALLRTRAPPPATAATARAAAMRRNLIVVELLPLAGPAGVGISLRYVSLCRLTDSTYTHRIQRACPVLVTVSPQLSAAAAD